MGVAGPNAVNNQSSETYNQESTVTYTEPAAPARNVIIK